MQPDYKRLGTLPPGDSFIATNTEWEGLHPLPPKHGTFHDNKYKQHDKYKHFYVIIIIQSRCHKRSPGSTVGPRDFMSTVILCNDISYYQGMNPSIIV